MADKIKILLNNEELRKQFIYNGIKFSKEFDIKIIGQKYIDIYNKIIKNYKYKPFKVWNNLTINIKKVFNL